MSNQIILTHRRKLVNRILSRNPLLRFNPIKNGTRKIDMCNLFAQRSLLSGNRNDDNKVEEFFQNLMENKQAKIQLPDIGSPVARLRTMISESKILERVSGSPSLFLAWPFACVPWDGHKPLMAPLLFWRIEKMEVRTNTLFVEMPDEAPNYNFMLEAWLRVRDVHLDFSSINELSEISIPEAINRISQITDSWEGCQNRLDENTPYKLEKHNVGTRLTILPCAVLGISHFKYLTLLQDLEQLADKVGPGENCGLLNEFLGTPSDLTKNPPKVCIPKESDKYLVEETDLTQEHAVWQAQQSKVMLLDGPPGTGKSQTIVNLIADAISKDQSVILVCHKSAALEVVKKRLDAEKVGLGNLVKTITEPRNQRTKFVGSIIDIVAQNTVIKPNDVDDRDTYSLKIVKAEEKYNNILKSRGDDKHYSVRGHLRGKIANIMQKTKFNPFAFTHEDLVKLINENTNDFTDDERRQKINNLQNFAENYRTCNYANNLWQKANLNHPNINLTFNDLIGDAQEMDKRKNDLPNALFLSMLFDKNMRSFSHQFFTDARRETIKKMAILITHTTRIFSEVGISPVPSIWEFVYQNSGGEKYTNYYNDVNYLDMIVHINYQLKNDNIIRILRDQMGIKSVDYWHYILDSIFCFLDNKTIPNVKEGDLRDAEEILQSIQYNVSEKRKADSKSINQKLLEERIENAVILMNNGLLQPRSTIRNIYHRRTNEIKKIFPALLMDPDSMCQILPLKPEIVDLAIIDEASQMFVADALPILYRAKRIIISGDDMQMPPYNSFALQDDENDDDDDDEYTNLESNSLPAFHAEHSALLDAVKEWIPRGDARCKLGIHYRSRPIELIAFSNHAFYDGKLQAAPNNKLKFPIERPIKVIPASGTFKLGINQFEIDEIIKCLKEIWSKNDALSTGVIVFNVQQASRLKKRLEEECENCKNFNAAYQTALNKETKQGEYAGFFARSVEHVQGDERDVIILGTTYNNQGNYGNISIREKGRRRLNVAVTRAKYGMFVITSLNISQISNDAQRPGDNNPQGKESWYLWKFMEYARAVSDNNSESSARILRSLNLKYDPRPIGQEPESQFEKDVGDFIIHELKYAVDYQVGEGGFRIDLGVKRNKEDANYLCGIECDGRFWHEGWRARHNDVWRQGILEDKGWKIYRIWSDYWYDNPKETKQKLHDYLQELVAALNKKDKK